VNNKEKIYFDTAPFIYFVENNPEFYQKLEDLIFQLVEDESIFYTSVLTQTEFSVHPIKFNRRELIDDYETMLSTMSFNVNSIDNYIAKHAAELRAKYPSLKTMDALQLASALTFECDKFITNDKGLIRINESAMTIVIISDL
jgi:predicted nucleic acid-binding protein